MENIDDDLSRELAFYNQVCTAGADPEFLDATSTSKMSQSGLFGCALGIDGEASIRSPCAEWYFNHFLSP